MRGSIIVNVDSVKYGLIHDYYEIFSGSNPLQGSFSMHSRSPPYLQRGRIVLACGITLKRFVMSKANSLPDFDEVCNILIPLGALNSPAELHGFLCGRLCGGAEPSESLWRQLCADFLDIDNSFDKDATAMLGRILSVTGSQFAEQAFGLQLLLPDDDSELAIRAETLGQWCHGFLTGFGAAGFKGEQTLSADVADAFRDLAAIVQIGGDIEEEEGEETNFMEVVEYVRMAVLTIHAECAQPLEDPADNTPTVH